MPDDLIDFTPELRAQALEMLKRYKLGPSLFNPPILGDVNGLLGAINIGNAGGGTNWPGVAYDPETHIVYAQAANAGVGADSLVRAAAGFLRHPLRVGRRRHGRSAKCSGRATAAPPTRRRAAAPAARGTAPAAAAPPPRRHRPRPRRRPA